MRRWILGLLALGVIATAGLAGSAFARPSTSANVLRIVSVKTHGVDPGGAVITVTFAGNIEQSLGRGALKKAVVAVILHPSSSTLATADIATRGAGAIGQTLTKTHSKDVGVVRSGRTLSFFIGGPGWSKVSRVEVKAFKSFPPARTTSSARVDNKYWEQIEHDIAFTDHLTDVTFESAGTYSCDGLRIVYESVLDDLARARLRTGDLNDLVKKIDAAVADAQTRENKQLFTATFWQTIFAPIGVADRLLTGTTPAEKFRSWRDAIRNLKLDRRLAEEYLKRNQALIEKLSELKGTLEGLRKAKCSTTTPPPPPKEQLYDYSFSSLQLAFDGPLSTATDHRVHVMEAFFGVGCGTATKAQFHGNEMLTTDGSSMTLAWSLPLDSGVSGIPYTWSWDSTPSGKVTTMLIFHGGASPTISLGAQTSGDIANLQVPPTAQLTAKPVSSC
jgi:hypothetical protein